jgi:hypothetical protein
MDTNKHRVSEKWKAGNAESGNGDLRIREIRNGFAILKLLPLSLLRRGFYEKALFLAGSAKHYRKFFRTSEMC